MAALFKETIQLVRDRCPAEVSLRAASHARRRCSHCPAEIIQKDSVLCESTVLLVFIHDVQCGRLAENLFTLRMLQGGGHPRDLKAIVDSFFEGCMSNRHAGTCSPRHLIAVFRLPSTGRHSLFPFFVKPAPHVGDYFMMI